MPGGRYPWAVRAGGPLLGGGGLPVLLQFDYEGAETNPDTLTVSSSPTWVPTITTGPTWYQLTQTNEFPMVGMRRIDNVFLTSVGDNFAGGSVTKVGNVYTFPGSSTSELIDATPPLSGVTGQSAGIRLDIRAISGSGTMELGITGIGERDIFIDSTQRTYFFGGTAHLTGGLQPRIRNRNTGAGGGPTAIEIEVSLTTYALIENASSPPLDFVDGAVPDNVGVNGVRVFDRLNANTEDAGGIVTDAVGALINGGGVQELPSTTKLSLHSRDLSDAVWSATNITAVRDALGLDAVQDAASTLTATANNGTIFQAFTRASSAHTHQAFVARKTGTGTVDITVDGGATWVDITSGLTSELQAFKTTQTLGNPSIGFRLGTSGDEIEVECSELEATAFATLPIVEDSATTLSRGATQVFYDELWPAEHSGFIDVTFPDDLGASNISLMGYAGAFAIDMQFFNDVQVRLLNGVDARVTAASSRLGKRQQFAFSLKVDECIIVDNLDNSATDLTGSPTTGTNIRVGTRGDGGSPFRGIIHSGIVWEGTQTEVQLKQKL